MGLFFQLTDKDFILLWFSVIIAWVFWLLGADKLFKFYFGIIIGFLLFLVFNSEVWLVLVLKWNPEIVLNSWQDFLSKNATFMLGFFTCMIPVFWLFFALNNDIHLAVRKSFLQSILFGLILPIFVFGIFVYVMKNSVIPLQFLKDILWLLDGAFLKTYFEESPHIVFFFLVFILFYKMVFSFIVLLFAALYNAIKKSKADTSAPVEHHEEEHHDSHHEEHGGHHH